MTKPATHRLLAAGAAALAVALVAGCGGGSNATVSSTPTTKTTAPPASASGTKVAVRQTGLGQILVDGAGRTLYLFEKDKGPRSTCYGACAGVWQPFTTSSRPAAGSGAQAAKLGTTRRSDGAQQVTYAGHPLYFYAPDRNPGDTKGQGLEQFGAEWYVLSSAGSKVEKEGGGGSSGGATTGGGSSSAPSGGSSGYGY